jgi:riboflavin kinase/FMN adenylyltransferase
MQIVRQLSQINLSRTQRSVLTIGSYDGIHRGHRQVIASLNQAANNYQVPSILITFHPRPKIVFAPHLKSDYLTTLEEKITIFKALKLDIVAILPFTLEFAQTPARTFMEQVFDAVRPLELWVGSDFKLGKNREGDVPFLQALGQEMGFLVKVVDLETVGGEKISSTQIREALATGQMRRVTHLLGDYAFVQGRVVQGAQRGHTVGFPTANIAVDKDKLLPANGVYAVWMHVAGEIYPAVANIGVRPTFDESEKTIEVHIFDFEQDIYGQDVRVDLVEYLRPEEKFASLDALIAQIGIDVKRAREILKSEIRPST